jgi:hypothetical protein
LGVKQLRRIVREKSAAEEATGRLRPETKLMKDVAADEIVPF